MLSGADQGIRGGQGLRKDRSVGLLKLTSKNSSEEGGGGCNPASRYGIDRTYSAVSVTLLSGKAKKTQLTRMVITIA